MHIILSSLALKTKKRTGLPPSDSCLWTCFRNCQVPYRHQTLNLPTSHSRILFFKFHQGVNASPSLPSSITIFMKLSLFVFRNPMVKLFKTNGLREVFSQWKLMLSAFLWLISLSRAKKEPNQWEDPGTTSLPPWLPCNTQFITLCIFSSWRLWGVWVIPVGWGTVILLLCCFLSCWQVRVARRSQPRASFVVCWLFRAYAFS